MLYWYGGMIKLLITGTSAVEIIPVPLAPAWHRITALVVTDKWRQTVCFGEVTFKLNLLTIVEHQCIGTQPFSTSSELLITSCSHKNLTTISQTVQELWDWQVNTQKHPPTKRYNWKQCHLSYATDVNKHDTQYASHLQPIIKIIKNAVFCVQFSEKKILADHPWTATWNGLMLSHINSKSSTDGHKAGYSTRNTPRSPVLKDKVSSLDGEKTLLGMCRLHLAKTKTQRISENIIVPLY